MFHQPENTNGLADLGTRGSVEAYEVEREAVIAMLERERRSLTASIISLSLLAIGVALLPNPAPMFVLLSLRLASFLLTRNAASRLERRVRMRRPIRWSQRILFGAMSLTGITLALMMWPQPPDASIVAVSLIQVVVIITVTLVSVTLAALPASRDAMLVSFWATGCAIILFHPTDVHSGFLAVLTLGVLGVRIYSSNTGQHIRSSAAVFVENRELSENLAEALAHAEFLSWRDPLTGLFNRRKLFEETRRTRSASTRHLLTIDLDRFKAINDTFGHAVGDHVLIESAKTIREWCEELDGNSQPLAFRMGGEEFLVIVHGLDDTYIAEAAEHLCESIYAIRAEFPDFPGIGISASMGLASWRFGEGLDDALLRADMACYEAKNTGRNRVHRTA